MPQVIAAGKSYCATATCSHIPMRFFIARGILVEPSRSERQHTDGELRHGHPYGAARAAGEKIS
jgi:hypothetical protein